MHFPNLHRLRLQHLRCLVTIARLGNMRAAAEKLAVSQPAVTKTIKELEELVGKPLLIRHRHGVSLTAAGQALVEQAQLGLNTLDNAISDAKQQPRRTLALGMLPTLSSGLPRRLLNALHALGLPRLRLDTDLNPQLLSRLQEGELDIVIGRLADPDHMLDLNFEPLWAEPLVVVMAGGHPLSQAPWEQWEGLPYPVVLPLPGTSLYQASQSFLLHMGPSAEHCQLETLTLAVAEEAVERDQAIWFTGLSSAKAGVGAKRWIIRRIPDAPSETIGLFTQTLHTQNLAEPLAAIRSQIKIWRQALQAQLSD
ncbi:MAG: LysR family transcriptional regulator [Pigmentiphaga sp.]|nr:LysR family transcriptional regulator [Pigmentiphaga sp.]